MDTRWQPEAPRLTANEADHLVEIWLRQRLTAGDQMPLDSSKLSLRELAQALGAREDELALMLCDIRDRSRSKGHKPPRRAIPVRRSWVFIVAIYAGVICLGACMYAAGNSHGQSYVRYQWRPDYYGSPVGNFDRYASRQRLPDEFGFKYRGQTALAQDYNSGLPLNWPTAEIALLDAIQKINGEFPSRLDTKVTAEEIATALAEGDKATVQIAPEPSRDGSSRVIPAPASTNRLIEWSRFTLTVRSAQISTIFPSAKVANEAVEKAVRQNTRERISNLIKAMQARLAQEDVPTLR